MGPEITVSTTVDVAWLQGQTKGSADVEIEFGGLAASTPVHIGFAVQQLAQARAAAEVLASFFLLLRCYCISPLVLIFCPKMQISCLYLGLQF